MSKNIVEFGAWSGVAALKNPEKYIKLYKSIGLDCIDIMINDGSKKGPFKLYFSEDKLVEKLNKFVNAGINVSITTWVQPEKSWTDGMEVVGRIATACKIRRVTLDPEESYVNPLKNKSDAEIFTWAVGIVGTLRKNFGGIIAAAPIVYFNRKVLDPLLRLVDVIIPQCYSTVKNVDGNGPVGRLERATAAIFKGYGKEIIMGQAAWNIEGAYGLSAPDAIRASLTSTLDSGIYKVMYWRLEFLTGEILKAVQEFTGNKQ